MVWVSKACRQASDRAVSPSTSMTWVEMKCRQVPSLIAASPPMIAANQSRMACRPRRTRAGSSLCCRRKSSRSLRARSSGPEAAIGYTIPNLLIDHALRQPHVPAGFWRGVNTNPNAIYLESFIDELAHAAGQDPLAFRLKLMEKHPKHRAVLQAVADKIGWDKPAPAGVFRGLSQIMGFGSYVAACAEVSVSDSGALKVHRIVAATDPGHVVNPQQVEAQIEGSFVYGLTAALYGECTVQDGRIVETNFDSYQMMRMDEMPAVESVLVPSGGFWGGVGEPTIAVAAPAVLNAIFAATGKRVRSIPVKNSDLRRA